SLGGEESYIPERHMSRLAALQIDRSRRALVTIQSATGYTGNFLVVDDGMPVLHHGDFSADESYIVGLPLTRSPWLFRLRGEKAIHASGAHGGSFRFRVVFNLNLVSAAQVNAAIRSL